jgi:hypothetical protein
MDMGTGKKRHNVGHGIVFRKGLGWVMLVADKEQPINYLEADGKPVEPPKNEEI